MRTIYRGTREGLEQIDIYESGAWINLVNPTPDEIREIVSWFQIPPDFLTDPLDIDERARVEREEGSTLIVLRIPHRESPGADIPYTTIPLGIILTQNVTITVCLTAADLIDEFLSGKVKHFSPDKQSRFILLLFYRNTLLYMRYLRDINRMTTQVERSLYRALKNEQLIHLLNLEKSLVFFVTSLRSNALMMEKFHATGCVRMSEEDRDLFEDMIIENKQALEMANIYSSILSDMMDAFASVISNNLNVIMKLLTTVTIILMIPTLVASVYGMNVALPFQDTPYAFAFTMALSVAFSAIGILIFWRKELL